MKISNAKLNLEYKKIIVKVLLFVIIACGICAIIYKNKMISAYAEGSIKIMQLE